MNSRYKEQVEKLLRRADVIINGHRPSDLIVNDDRFYQRFLSDGRVGLGEAYMENWWECKDLPQLFYKLTRTQVVTAKDKFNLEFLLTLVTAKLLPKGGIKRSHEIGKKHYDISEDLYRRMLDDRLVYTCGYYQSEESLDKAQEAKLDLVCKKLKLQPGMKLLDVGCGWGSFAKFAAEKYGAEVTGVTISQAQIDLGKKLCQGLPVELRYQDYRDVNEKFDRIVSIGMFEHVGQKYYKTYFEKMRHCLKDDGIFLLHTIGTNKSNWSNNWLTKYIFPGGYIPSLKDISHATEGVFVLEDLHNFGQFYDKTLCHWFERFHENWDAIEKAGYDDIFYRMWKYYLLSSAGGFRSRFAQLWQFVFTKQGMVGGYHFDNNYLV